MYRFILAIVFITFSSAIFAQAPADTGFVKVNEDPRVMLMAGKWAEVKERTDGKMDGWRVKIHFGSDRDKAKSVKTGFISRYPDVPAYEIYEQPLFVILVGNFRTRMEAFRYLQEIKSDYPAAFIVQEKIEPPKIETTEFETVPVNGTGTGGGR